MRGLDAGLMNERISILTANIGRSELGEQTVTWSEIGTYFATVRATSGGVKATTGEIVLTQSLKVWMRYLDHVNDRCRVKWRGDTYRVKNLNKEYQLGRMTFLLEKLDE